MPIKGIDPLITYPQFIRENAPYLAVGAILAMLSSFGQTFFISIFGGEIREEFGLSNGDWGAIYMVGTAASAAVMVFAGGLADVFRVRTLGVAVVVALGLACIAMAVNTSAAFVVAVIFLLRFFGQGMSMHMSVVAMSRWFVATRGRALAVAGMGYMIGEMTLPLVMVWLKSLVDWRILWVCFAMSFAGFGTAFWFHQVHFAEVKGWSHLSLVAIFPLGTATLMASTILFGWAIDRFGAVRLLPIYLFPYVLAYIIHWYAPSLWWTALAMILMGMSGGGNATLLNACWAEFYGTKHLGAIKAAATAVMVLGSALGPGVSGWLIDAGVGIEIQMLGYAAFFVICAVFLRVAAGIYARSAGPA